MCVSSSSDKKQKQNHSVACVCVCVCACVFACLLIWLCAQTLSLTLHHFVVWPVLHEDLHHTWTTFWHFPRSWFLPHLASDPWKSHTKPYLYLCFTVSLFHPLHNQCIIEAAVCDKEAVTFESTLHMHTFELFLLWKSTQKVLSKLDIKSTIHFQTKPGPTFHFDPCNLLEKAHFSKSLVH